MYKQFNEQIKIYGNKNQIEKAIRYLEELELVGIERYDRLIIQDCIDENKISATIAYGGNKVYPNNTFYRFSSQKGGSIIDFIMEYREVGLSQAIAIASDYYKTYQPEQVGFDFEVEKEDTKYFQLPQKHNNNDRVKKYLIENRKIDKNVVDSYLKKGLLYEDHSHNCVFVGVIDDTGVAASMRSSSPSSDWKGDVAGNYKAVGCFYPNEKSTDLFVTESVIDAMSLQSRMSSKKQGDYLATNGVANVVPALELHLTRRRKESDKYQRIVLALDNDEAGKEATEKAIQFLQENYKEKYDVVVFKPEGKDWNEDLISYKNYYDKEKEKANTVVASVTDEASLEDASFEN